MNEKEALSILKTGANVFLTGKPGSGKTYTVNAYVSYLRSHGIEPAVTASTGIAATHIGGFTIHSWSGIGIKKSLTERDVDEMTTRERLVSRVSRARVLIIDEISMLDARTLSAVDIACRALRRSQEPFGGMQIVFVGDFFQLPPVSREAEEPIEFAFLSPSWQEAKSIVCYLSEQYRQDDAVFLSVLSAVRSGRVDDKVHTALLSRKVLEMPKSEPQTRLYSHNVNVDRVNEEKLSGLAGEEAVFEMTSRGPQALVMGLKRGCLSPEVLRLKVGAEVMFTKNSLEHKFVNGTLGTVVSFSYEGAPIVKTRQGRRIEVSPLEWTITDGSRTLAKIIQLPLRLAWAITVHKSQGMTLDAAVIDLSEAFEYGQGYVALSRLRSLSGLFLLGYNARSLEVHPEILKVDGGFEESSRAAREMFGNISADERATMEYNFIRACGGTLDKRKAGEKKERSNRKIKTGEKTTHDETLAILKEGKSLEEIARTRGLVRGTIIAHLEELFMRGQVSIDEVRALVAPELIKKFPKIMAALRAESSGKLSPVFTKLGGIYSYDELRLARLCMNAKSEVTEQ